jgi:hypothetical protein
MANALKKFSLKQLRDFARIQVTDIVVNKQIGIQQTFQRQKALGDDPHSNAGSIISYQGTGTKETPGLVSAHYVYYLNGYPASNYWTIVSFDTNGNQGSGRLLGIALGDTYPKTNEVAKNGVLLRGVIKIPIGQFRTNAGWQPISTGAYVGYPVYGWTSILQQYSFEAPSTSGNASRVLGHCLGLTDDLSGVIMYFNPSLEYTVVS